MLQYIYVPAIDLVKVAATTENPMIILRLYEVADKSDLPGLQDNEIELFSTYFSLPMEGSKIGKVLVGENDISDIIDQIYQLARCTRSLGRHTILQMVLENFTHGGIAILHPVAKLLLISCVNNNAEFYRDASLHEFDPAGSRSRLLATDAMEP
jgi:hypothetical protein